MNALDVLKYGHQTVLEAIDGIPDTDWYTEGVSGIWSVKDIIAHLASFEHLLVEVLRSFSGTYPTPTLDRFIADPQRFNDDEVAQRRHKTAQEVWAEYTETRAQAMTLLARIPVKQRRLHGTLPWYGQEYSLEDFIVYSFYGHKREHSAQINAFHNQLASIIIQASMEVRPALVL